MKISKQEAAHYIWGAKCDGWHLVQGETLSVIHERMPAGTTETRHVHSKSRQFFLSLVARLAWSLTEKRTYWSRMKALKFHRERRIRCKIKLMQTLNFWSFHIPRHAVTAPS